MYISALFFLPIPAISRFYHLSIVLSTDVSISLDADTVCLFMEQVILNDKLVNVTFCNGYIPIHLSTTISDTSSYVCLHLCQIHYNTFVHDSIICILIHLARSKTRG